VPAQLSCVFKFTIRVVGMTIKGEVKNPKMFHIGLSDSLSIHDMSGFQFVSQTLGES